MCFSVVSAVLSGVLQVHFALYKIKGMEEYLPPLAILISVQLNYFLIPNFSISARYLSISVFFR